MKPTFTKQELSDLFEIASYSNDAFCAHYNKDCDIRGEGEFKTDKLADILCKGGTIDFCDFYAEDEDDTNGMYQDSAYYDGETMNYPVTLDDISNRLDAFISSKDEYASYIGKLYFQAKDDMGNIDMPKAWNICQAIMFGELIYG